MSRSKQTRLQALEAALAAREARPEGLKLPGADAMVELGKRLLFSLPDHLRRDLEADRVRNVGRLIEGLWELGGNIGPSRTETALRAYCVAFKGVNLWQIGSEAALDAAVQHVLDELGVDV